MGFIEHFKDDTPANWSNDPPFPKKEVGRPPMYKSSEELRQKIDSFFKDNKTPTISGLAHYLGFESRQSFYDYEQKEEFTYTIRKIRLFMESVYEERLHGNNPTGAIFWLKNAGWKDKQEIDQKTTIEDERIDESKLTDEELRTLIEIQRKGSISKA